MKLLGQHQAMPVIIIQTVKKPDNKFVQTTVIENGIKKTFVNGLEKINNTGT